MFNFKRPLLVTFFFVAVLVVNLFIGIERVSWEAFAQVPIVDDNVMVDTGQIEEKGFVNLLRDKKKRDSSTKQVVEAIRGLGRLARQKVLLSAETVEILTEYLDLPGDVAEPDAFVNQNISPQTPVSIYPAIESLNYIGEEALPATIRVLENEDSSSLTFQNAIWAIMSIHKADFGKTHEFLKEAAKLSPTVEGRKNILIAARTVASYDTKIRD